MSKTKKFPYDTKQIKGFEHKYLVSNIGEVFRITKKGTRAVKARTIASGHLNVTLCKNGEQGIFYVDRLVASHFMEPTTDQKYVLHKDDDLTNCHINNLEWLTKQQRQEYIEKDNKYFRLLRKHRDGLSEY